jgi:hypothetical protein
MKILVFIGGLGNQILGFAFYKYLHDKYPQKKIYGVYSSARLNEHHGLEINKWFDVQMPESRWYITLFTYFMYVLKKVFGYTALLDLDILEMKKENAIIYWALRNNKNYIPDGKWINFSFDENELSDSNKRVLNEIRSSNSVFVHVRRGDYFSPYYKDRFEGCCSIDYYRSAIEYVKEQISQPKFFVFSDDITWSKENLPLKETTFIDWNKGKDSPLDMFLMSNCKVAIIANSTFSFWGAKLGEPKTIVTYPKRWFNPPYEVGDLFYPEWISF